VLASTKSPASRSRSSLGPYKGDLGNAIRPVLADSRIPKGAMSFMKESILVGFAELVSRQCREGSGKLLILTLPQCSYSC
jgi:hypothetical protein